MACDFRETVPIVNDAHPAAFVHEIIVTLGLETSFNPVAMKAVFTRVDPVIVKSGHTVYVFTIRGNEFRLIAAVHFNRRVVYTLRFFTHAEYDRQNWENEL